MHRLTIDELNAAPWRTSAAQYQAVAGVKQPWIAEISPYQYAHLSKRGRAQYDRKREAEWSASAACKQGWAARVIAAHDAGQFSLNDPDVSAAAHAVITTEQQRRAEEAEAERKRIAERTNRITDASQLHVGDRVWSVMTRHYCIVRKVNRLSVRVAWENPPAWVEPGRTFLERPTALQWLSPDDL